MRASVPEAGSGDGPPGRVFRGRHSRRRPAGTPGTGRPRWPGGRRRTVALLVAAGLVVGVAAGFGQGLVRDAPDDRAEPARPLSAEEAARLARVRQLNWQDGRAGVRATVGTGGGQVYLTGWVDWRRPMVYLARSGPEGTVTELVQAVPGMVATRPAGPPAAGPSPAATPAPTPTATPAETPAATRSPEVVDPHPPPPRQPPADGWRLRRPGEDGPAGAPQAPGTIDALAVLLLTVTAEEPDAAALLAASESQWLRRDRTAGHEVDVLLGPAIPPTPSPTAPTQPPTPAGDAPTRTPRTSLAAMGGAVQYWIDDGSRLHRLEALLADGVPVRVDLDRGDDTAPGVLDVLGGAAIDPRPVTRDEAEMLAGLRQRNLQAGGGEVTLTAPDEDGGTVRAAGWLDWRSPVAYLAMYRDGDPDGLLWADGRGVATRPAAESSEHAEPSEHAESAESNESTEDSEDGAPAEVARPPVPAPQDAGWERSAWEQRGDDQGGWDLDLLLNEVLALSDGSRDDAGALRENAIHLRADTLAGAPVSVYEIPRSIESRVEPGGARMRYWVDDESGVLVRLEIRTRSGGFGQLDLDPGPVPALG